MRRLTVCTVAVLAFLTWSTLAVVNGEKNTRPDTVRPSVTIVFRGLLAFHPDPARQYFEAGILRAPEHRFRIEVREKSSAGVSSFAVPTESITGAPHDVWSFEFTSAAKRGVSFYQNGAFD